MRVLLAGASGFLGSRVAMALAADGHTVIHAGRAPAGSPGIPVDFAAVPKAGWWVPRLAGVDVVINAVGIFREHGMQTFEALHTSAPLELFRAAATVGVRLVVQISALGADAGAETAYHRSKHAADEGLRALPVPSVVVQPSLVYSLQGRSAALFNQLAVLPVLPLPARGAPLQPVHADDVVAGLMRLVREPAVPSRTVAFVGPQAMSLRRYLASLRKGLGLRSNAIAIPVPQKLCLAFGRAAGWVPGSPIDQDAVRMLLRGNQADAAPFSLLLGYQPLPVEAFIDPGEADGARAQAVLGWMLPLLNVSIALVWIWTGLVSLGLYPVDASMQLLAQLGLSGAPATAALYAGGGIDLALGPLALALRGRARVLVWLAMLAVMAAYTALITERIPHWWLHPFGPISKNLPMLAAIALLCALERPRR